MSKINVFSGAQEFLNLDYPCSIIFCGKPFPSLWHSMVAAMTLDEDIKNRISDNQFNLTPSTIANLWKEVWDYKKYKIDVVDMVASKYANPILLNRLLSCTTDCDEFVYAADPSGVVGIATAMLRQGRNVSEILQALELQ